MLSIAKLKLIRSLNKKKFRQKYNIFVAEGHKISKEILLYSKNNIHSIYCLSDWQESNRRILEGLEDKINVISENELKKISFLSTPNQVLLLLETPQYQLEDALLSKQLTLVLDGIQDPGNLGTIWRIADWFGISQIICSSTCAGLFSPKVIQSTMGAFLRVPAYRMELLPLLDQYPDLPIYGAVMAGKNIHTAPLTGNGFIVLGNESQGISDPVLAKLTQRITVPSYGKAESLNAAVAAGIVCAVFRAQYPV